LRKPREDGRVVLQEVGPRDGLQNEARALSPEIRAQLIDSLVNSGLARIQIGSFVDARRVPQMAGTDQVWQLLRKQVGVRYSVLVLNRRGLESAISAGVPCVEIYVSASETHSLKNVGTSVAIALAEASSMIKEALTNGLGVTAGVMCAFGCHFEGAVPVEKVVEIVAELDGAGQEYRPHPNPLPEGEGKITGKMPAPPVALSKSPRPVGEGQGEGHSGHDLSQALNFETVEIGLADTTGMGDPKSVARVLEAVAGRVGMDRIALHLHDTRGFGMANLWAAVAIGVRQFDTSVGGLGGCPFIPGAAGNIATERVAEEVESKGFSTGVDAQKVRKIAGDLAALLGTDM
jgi:hydroxymethylglutaryl-CoA lyase